MNSARARPIIVAGTGCLYWVVRARGRRVRADAHQQSIEVAPGVTDQPPRSSRGAAPWPRRVRRFRQDGFEKTTATVAQAAERVGIHDLAQLTPHP
jgi:hypothetical protein